MQIILATLLFTFCSVKFGQVNFRFSRDATIGIKAAVITAKRTGDVMLSDEGQMGLNIPKFTVEHPTTGFALFRPTAV